MLWLALPVLAEQLLTMLVGYTDWWLAGHYLDGPAPKAAMGLMAYVLWLIPSLFSAVAIGATALVARFVGAGDLPAAARVTHQAILSGIVLAVIGTVAVMLGGPSFVRSMQLTGPAADLAIRYLVLLIPVIPAIMIEQVGIACLRGAGDTVSAFVAKSIVNVANIAISAALVVGWGPFPELGWDGLAIGTACGHGLGGVIILGVLCRGRAGLRLRAKWLRPDGALQRRLFRIGVPGGVDQLAILGCHLVFVAIINRMGTEAAAAHGLGITLESTAYLPGAAFQVAAATLAGQYLGAGDQRRAVRSAIVSCLMGGGMMLAAGLVFFFGAETLTAFFTGDANDPTAVATAPLMRIVAFAMPSLALAMILSGALRGAGDTRWPLVITLLGFFGVRIPGAIWLGWTEIPLPLLDVTLTGWGLGVEGAWYAMVIDVVLRSLLIVGRFWQGGWRRIVV